MLGNPAAFAVARQGLVNETSLKSPLMSYGIDWAWTISTPVLSGNADLSLVAKPPLVSCLPSEPLMVHVGDIFIFKLPRTFDKKKVVAVRKYFISDGGEDVRMTILNLFYFFRLFLVLVKVMLLLLQVKRKELH
jgi:hypothetical protein